MEPVSGGEAAPGVYHPLQVPWGSSTLCWRALVSQHIMWNKGFVDELDPWLQSLWLLPF